MDEKHYNVAKAIIAQADYCLRKGLPYFAPHDGYCFRCHCQIYEVISVEQAGAEHITGCPYCRWSYCE